MRMIRKGLVQDRNILSLGGCQLTLAPKLSPQGVSAATLSSVSVALCTRSAGSKSGSKPLLVRKNGRLEGSTPLSNIICFRREGFGAGEGGRTLLLSVLSCRSSNRHRAGKQTPEHVACLPTPCRAETYSACCGVSWDSTDQTSPPPPKTSGTTDNSPRLVHVSFP